MTQRNWKPGGKKYGGNARIADTTVAWVKCVLGQFSLVRYPNQPDEEDEETFESSGPTYLLVIPRRYGAPAKINLTALTHEEFLALRYLVATAFELAEPIVQFRDKESAHAAEQGDLSFVRNYRQPPQLVERKGSLREDDQSILDGLEDALGARPDGDHSDQPGGGDQPPVAPDDAQDRGPQDDAAQTD